MIEVRGCLRFANGLRIAIAFGKARRTPASGTSGATGRKLSFRWRAAPKRRNTRNKPQYPKNSHKPAHHGHQLTTPRRHNGENLWEFLIRHADAAGGFESTASQAWMYSPAGAGQFIRAYLRSSSGV